MYSATKVATDQSATQYRLLGIHVATKEVRDWTWTSLWWSDTPDTDFGADRPEWFGIYQGQTIAPLRHYKMCINTGFKERDQSLLAKLPGFVVSEADRSLEGAMLSAYAHGDARRGVDGDEVIGTWCSNPFLERDTGMADTSCIGCHQHAAPGSRMEFTRHQERRDFPTDYAWSFEFYMDMIGKENDNFKDKFAQVTAKLAGAPQETCGAP